MSPKYCEYSNAVERFLNTLGPIVNLSKIRVMVPILYLDRYRMCILTNNHISCPANCTSPFLPFWKKPRVRIISNRSRNNVITDVARNR